MCSFSFYMTIVLFVVGLFGDCAACKSAGRKRRLWLIMMLWILMVCVYLIFYVVLPRVLGNIHSLHSSWKLRLHENHFSELPRAGLGFIDWARFDLSLERLRKNSWAIRIFFFEFWSSKLTSFYDVVRACVCDCWRVMIIELTFSIVELFCFELFWLNKIVR